MNTTAHTSKRVWAMLLNRQLREWNDNITLELGTCYALDSRHKQERSRLRLQTTDLYEQAALTAQQLQEATDLKQRHQGIRIDIQERHARERETFTARME